MKNIYHIFINKVMPIRILWAVLTFVCCITWNGKVYGQQALPYSYGFENNDLSAAGWTLNNCVSGSVINTDSHHDGSYGFFFYYTTNPPQYLISPRLTGTDNGVHVEF